MKDMKGKITGLKAKKFANFPTGKDPKKVITSTKVKGSGVNLPSPKGKKPTMRAKSVSKMG